MTTDTTIGTCYCGKPAEKISSGRPECWDCWNWRKLDGPAARHWARVGMEFLSNIDMHDRTRFFAKCGLSTEDAVSMVTLVDRLTHSCQQQIEEHGEKIAGVAS